MDRQVSHKATKTNDPQRNSNNAIQQANSNNIIQNQLLFDRIGTLQNRSDRDNNVETPKIDVF